MKTHPKPAPASTPSRPSRQAYILPTHTLWALIAALILSTGFAKVSNAQAYAELNRKPGNGIYRLESNQLYFTFFEPYHYDQDLEYQIKDENGNMILEVNPNTSPAANFLVRHRRGKNLIQLDLSSLALTSGTHYQLSVFAGKDDTYYLTILKP